MGPAGFEPAISSARGWHHTKLDNGPPLEKYSSLYYKLKTHWQKLEAWSFSAESSDAGVIGAELNTDTSQGISNSLPLLCFED